MSWVLMHTENFWHRAGRRHITALDAWISSITQISTLYVVSELCAPLSVKHGSAAVFLSNFNMVSPEGLLLLTTGKMTSAEIGVMGYLLTSSLPKFIYCVGLRGYCVHTDRLVWCDNHKTNYESFEHCVLRGDTPIREAIGYYYKLNGWDISTPLGF